MTKVYTLAPKEDWIVDRLVSEWKQHNSDMSTDNIYESDIVWLFADWTWNKIPGDILRKKKVITTVHHIVPEKFNEQAIDEFYRRDDITNEYHVPNVYTKEFIEKYTQKKITVIPYWANQNIWRKTAPKSILRDKFSILQSDFVVGSFQRDTEGSDLRSPKLEKGPDILGDYLEHLRDSKPNLHVLLAGWRRQYIISRLEKANIKYTYIQLPSQEVVNELYQILDLYPVTARYEGGPQSLIECGLLDIPVISRKIGIADAVLPHSAISNLLIDAKPAISNVTDLILPRGFERYRKLFNMEK
jgi:glycosyltransferase involved in cell wall biosynthesis